MGRAVRLAAFSSLSVLCALCGLAAEYERPAAAYPPDWTPADLADARERAVGTSVEVYVSVGGVEVSAPREFRCRVGHREELPLVLSRRGSMAKRIVITGAGPRGVSLDPTDVKMGTRKLAGRVTPAVQTLLLRDTYLMITVEVAEETASMPVKLLAEPTWPVFGAHLPDADRCAGASRDARRALQGAADMPAQSLEPARGAESADRASLDALLAATRSRPPLLLPLADWVAPETQAIRDAVERRRGDVHAFSVGSLPALAGDTQDAAAAGRAVLQVAAGLSRAATELDLAAEILSPTFPRTAADEGTFEGRLLRWLLGNGIGEHVSSVSFDLGAAPVPGVGEPESWRELDRSADISALSRLVADAPGEPGIWCGAYGVVAGGEPVPAALAAVRRQVALAFQGVRGAAYSPLAFPGLRPAGPDEPVPLCTASEGGQPAIAAALGEALTELAGVRPVHGADDSPPCSTRLGSEITFLPFLRGSEGIVWVWSNAAAPSRLRLILRQEPLGRRELTLRPKQPFIQRDADPLFVAQRRPRDRSHYVEFTLAPLEIKAFTFPIFPPLPAWLATVAAR
ncbi:MAG: hypothetical protein PVH68_03880 [Armatimonadota bacterium]|jgi:hypothetical protein